MSGNIDTCSYLLSQLKWWGKNGHRGGGGGKTRKVTRCHPSNYLRWFIHATRKFKVLSSPTSFAAELAHMPLVPAPFLATPKYLDVLGKLIHALIKVRHKGAVQKRRPAKNTNFLDPFP